MAASAANAANAANYRHATDASQDLIELLQLAYSGELGAALAYRGHWKSLPEGEDRRCIEEVVEAYIAQNPHVVN